jgi:uncharacterized protein (TIGR00369 family)
MRLPSGTPCTSRAGREDWGSTGQDGWRRTWRRSGGEGAGPDKARIARQFIEAIPFSKALGMRLDEIGDGVAVISMPYDPALVGDPQTGVIHGGAVSALMDTCGGAAVMCHPEALAATATIDLRIDYMRPAHAGRPDHGTGPLLSRHALGRLRPGRGLGQRRGRPVASATGAFTVQREGGHERAPSARTGPGHPPAPRPGAFGAGRGRALSRLHGHRLRPAGR